MCSFLADTWCLGVKNAMGPKRMRRREFESAITFGMDGEPHYVNGPYEDPQRVLATLERSVGRGGFHYTSRSARPTISAMAITTRLFSPIATPPSRRPMRRYLSQDEAQPPCPERDAPLRDRRCRPAGHDRDAHQPTAGRAREHQNWVARPVTVGLSLWSSPATIPAS
jgi:hypothetical protein